MSAIKLIRNDQVPLAVIRLANYIRLRRESGTPFVVLLGAGASIESGYPSGRDFVRQFLEQTQGASPYRGSDDEHIRKIFDDEWNAAGPNNRELIFNKLLPPASPSLGYLALARLARKKFFRVFATTNPDSLMEEAASLTHRSPRDWNVLVAGYDSPAKIRTELLTKSSQTTVLKLHGDYRSGHLRFTSGDLERFEPQLRPVVSNLLNTDLIVIGHSLSDPDLIDILTDAELGEAQGTLWWVGPDQPTQQVEAALSERLLRANTISGDYGRFDQLLLSLHLELTGEDLRDPRTFQREVVDFQASRFSSYLTPDAENQGHSRSPLDPVKKAALTAWQAAGPTSSVDTILHVSESDAWVVTQGALQRVSLRSLDRSIIHLPPAYRAGNALNGHRQVRIASSEPSLLYSDGAKGLYKSSDHGDTWDLILDSASLGLPQTIRAIAVSPVNSSLIYAELCHPTTVDYHFVRSRDGGRTWESLSQFQAANRAWFVSILQAHPTRRESVFRASTFFGVEGINNMVLWESDDSGKHWTNVFRSEYSIPIRIIGGLGKLPQRFYLIADRARAIGGSTLFRSNSGGVDWDPMLLFRGGGPMQLPNADNVQMKGLSYDPSNPDSVYVSLAGDKQDVLSSKDGGNTWESIGESHLGIVNDIAVSADGSALFAATETGLWQRPIASISSLP